MHAVIADRAAFFPVTLSAKNLSARPRSARLSEVQVLILRRRARVAKCRHVYLPNPVSLVRFV
jgi:hypothetical protein